jgi:microtubule-associated protein-like 1/2
MNTAAIKSVNRAHYSLTKEIPSELSALCTHHEIEGSFFTCGDDGTLRQWDYKTRRCVRVLNLNIDKQGSLLCLEPNTREIQQVSKLKALDVNLKTELIGVGCEDGTVRIISVKSWSQITMFKHRKSRIRVTEFSPDGLFFAVGSDEGFIDIYTVPLFKSVNRLKKNCSPITHLDWSIDSNFIQLTNIENDLIYLDVKKGVFLPNGFAMLRDEPWKEWRCHLGWPVQGVYNPSTLRSTSVSCVHRSPPLRDNTHIIAVGLMDSRIKVYRYPVLNYNAQFLELKGHGGAISDICFSPGGTHMFSSGADDLTVIQWKLTLS